MVFISCLYSEGQTKPVSIPHPAADFDLIPKSRFPQSVHSDPTWLVKSLTSVASNLIPHPAVNLKTIPHPVCDQLIKARSRRIILIPYTSIKNGGIRDKMSAIPHPTSFFFSFRIPPTYVEPSTDRRFIRIQRF